VASGDCRPLVSGWLLGDRLVLVGAHCRLTERGAASTAVADCLWIRPPAWDRVPGCGV